VKAQKKEMGAMMLKNKVAVIYGCNGAVGDAGRLASLDNQL
jgi:hypothetical protein